MLYNLLDQYNIVHKPMVVVTIEDVKVNFSISQTLCAIEEYRGVDVKLHVF